MQRSKFPYTARSSAKVIRHAVSIDERRAKFRSDLISEAKTSRPNEKHNSPTNGQKTSPGRGRMTNLATPNQANVNRFRRRSQYRSTVDVNGVASPRLSAVDGGRLNPQQGLKDHSRSMSSANARNVASDVASIKTSNSVDSYQPEQYPNIEDDDEEDEVAEQDIEELWFPGCHADLGGGWPLADGEESPLSHGPLVWMVREAQRAGLEFDSDKLLRFKCCDEDYEIPSRVVVSDEHPLPQIHVSQPFSSPKSEHQEPGCRYISSFFPSYPDARIMIYSKRARLPFSPQTSVMVLIFRPKEATLTLQCVQGQLVWTQKPRENRHSSRHFTLPRLKGCFTTVLNSTTVLG